MKKGKRGNRQQILLCRMRREDRTCGPTGAEDFVILCVDLPPGLRIRKCDREKTVSLQFKR